MEAYEIAQNIVTHIKTADKEDISPNELIYRIYHLGKKDTQLSEKACKTLLVRLHRDSIEMDLCEDFEFYLNTTQCRWLGRVPNVLELSTYEEYGDLVNRKELTNIREIFSQYQTNFSSLKNVLEVSNIRSSIHKLHLELSEQQQLESWFVPTIRALPNFEELILAYWHVDYETLRTIPQLKHLELIDCFGCENDFINTIQNLPSIENLSLSLRCPVTREGIDALVDYTNKTKLLKSLTIWADLQNLESYLQRNAHVQVSIGCEWSGVKPLELNEHGVETTSGNPTTR